MHFTSLLSFVLLTGLVAVGNCGFGHHKASLNSITDGHSRGNAIGSRSIASTYQDMLLRDISSRSFLDSSGARSRKLTCKSLFSLMAELQVTAINASANGNGHPSQLERPKLQYQYLLYYVMAGLHQ